MMQSNSQDSQVTSCETKLGRAMDEHAQFICAQRANSGETAWRAKLGWPRKAYLPRKLPDKALCWATTINT